MSHVFPFSQVAPPVPNSPQLAHTFKMGMQSCWAAGQGDDPHPHALDPAGADVAHTVLSATQKPTSVDPLQ